MSSCHVQVQEGFCSSDVGSPRRALWEGPFVIKCNCLRAEASFQLAWPSQGFRGHGSTGGGNWALRRGIQR